MDDKRRKRLRFRCHHCGMHENDILFGRLADRHLAAMDDGQLTRLEALLEQNDVDLFNWITGTAPVPADFDHDVMGLLQDINKEL